MIKTHQSHHKTKFLIICNNPRIASTKTQSRFCNKTSLRKTSLRKDEHLMISKLRYLSFLETKIRFKNSQTFGKKNNPKVVKSQKLSRKRWQVINFSPLSFQNSSKKRSRTQAFQQILHLIFETNISFQNSNTQTSFLTAPTMIKHES